MQRIKFIDRMSTGKLSRREMLKSATAFGVGAAAAGIGAALELHLHLGERAVDCLVLGLDRVVAAAAEGEGGQQEEASHPPILPRRQTPFQPLRI